MSKFHELLLSELRILESKENKTKEKVSITKENAKGETPLEFALLDKDNLNAIGYDLKEEGVLKLAKDYSMNYKMTPLYQRVMEMEPSIEVNPMYPNFPKQVLEMDEKEFRIDQVLHYMSTYGLEDFLGIQVDKGYLPETKDIIEREEDKQVVSLKTLDYLYPNEVDKKVIQDVMGKKERLLPGELELAKTVMLRTNERIENIPFKENIENIYGDVILQANKSKDLTSLYKTFDSLKFLLKHPGDVLDLLEYVVVKNKYKHLKTSVKRGFVELIEQFSTSAIEENLASNKWSKRFLGKHGKSRKINRNIALIDYLSYNRFSKNDEAKKIVSDLKDGKLISWNQKLEKAYSENNNEKVLGLLSQRPGIMFRQVNRMVKSGIDKMDILKTFDKKAGELKTQSIVSAINNYEGEEKFKEIVDNLFINILIMNLRDNPSEEFKGKKVYLEESEVDFSRSKLEISDKFEEGGYIRNGMAIKIPDEAKYLRFFTYWNDDQRIDIDLHGVTVDSDEDISHVGWNGNKHNDGLVHSGDITHSDAAEYIDLDLDKAKSNNIIRTHFNINSYTGVPFNKIETVFTGVLALSKMGEKANLFDSKNIIFRHDLNSKGTAINYGLIDLENNLIYIDGKISKGFNDTSSTAMPEIKLSINTYIGLLVTLSGGEVVFNEDDSDIVLGLAKEDKENYISLIDENFFM